MGLDTTHDCWHGSYSYFNNWRNELARIAGYKITKGPHGFEMADIDWASIKSENYQGEWEQLPSDPLLVLITHSDCDGIIKAEHCNPLRNRLLDILEWIPKDNTYLVDKTKQFINGLERAIKRNQKVSFH